MEEDLGAALPEEADSEGVVEDRLEEAGRVGSGDKRTLLAH